MQIMFGGQTVMSEAFGRIPRAGKRAQQHGRQRLLLRIACGLVKDALELVESGKINCDVECNPLQGELLAEVIRKLEAGESVEKEYFVDELVFTRENVRNYLDDRVY